jgi:hypothetical protein
MNGKAFARPEDWINLLAGCGQGGQLGEVTLGEVSQGVLEV